MLKIISAACVAFSLSACGTLDGAGARLAASDVSLMETALFVNRIQDVKLDISNPDDRYIIYKSVDSYRAFKTGKITEDELLAEVNRLLDVS